MTTSTDVRLLIFVINYPNVAALNLIQTCIVYSGPYFTVGVLKWQRVASDQGRKTLKNSETLV